jgi:hypothetical protein
MCMTSASGTRGWGQAAGCLTSATTYDLMSPLCSGLSATRTVCISQPMCVLSMSMAASMSVQHC